MIRISHEDFSAGTHDVTALHGRAERGAGGVTIYLLPGLTTGQRGAVVRRLRQEASRGFGPPLPQPQLALALGLDRMRRAAGIAGTILRRHPAVTLLPGIFIAAVMALFVMVSVGVPAVPGGPPGTPEGLANAAPAGGGNAPDAGRWAVPAFVSGITPLGMPYQRLNWWGCRHISPSSRVRGI